MIKFIEHSETGYAMRTWDNARLSDLTIAFAVDFTTAGEILTRKAAYGKYYGVNLSKEVGFKIEDLQELIDLLKIKKVRKLNIAGNGIYSLAKIGWDQEMLDATISYLLILITKCYPDIISIRSGGQTGVDEAALKAGDKLGLETICLAPKNWMFRNIDGKDICSQVAFLKRFGSQYDATDIL